MARLSTALFCLCLLAAGAGCSDRDPYATAPESLPAEVETRVQEREALKYGLDQFEREAEARRALGLPVPEGDQPAGAPALRPGP
jgi:hypothetical protein